MRVLIIEDDTELLSSLCEVFERHGIFAEAANSFSGAKSFIEKDPFDYVLVDLILGEDSGWDLIPLIQTQSHGPHPKIVISSGNIDKKARDRADIWKFCDKPYNIAQLVNEIQSDQKETSACSILNS